MVPEEEEQTLVELLPKEGRMLSRDTVSFGARAIFACFICVRV